MIHLIVTQLKKNDCGTLPAAQTTELRPLRSLTLPLNAFQAFQNSGVRANNQIGISPAS